MSIQLLEAAAAAAAARASVGAAVGAAPAVLFLAPCWRRRRVTHYALASDARVSRDQQPQQQNQEQQQQQPLQQQQQQQQQQPAALVSNSRRPRALWWSQQLLPPHLALSSSSSGSSIGGGIGIGGGAWRAFASSSARGELPKEGPDHASIVAVPFAVTRAQADEAFARFHSRHWLQNPSLPRWAGQADEAFLPFWVGEATVAVEVHSAEVGRDEVVRRYDARTGRYDTRYETVWRRVDLTTPLSWRFHHAPEDAAMQLFASYKYPRGDVEALRPGALIGRATKITPDMLQAWPGAPSETRRVGAFTVTPDVARRLLKGRIESAERQRAEQQVSAATGFPHVRFVQMTLAWLGPADDGPRLSPLYVPAFVYAYSHAGVKVRSFVSGVDGRAAGAHYLDDSKTATLATAAVGGALLLSGAAGVMAPAQLFVAALIAPFAVSTFLARFWPAIRGLWLEAKGRLQQAWDTRGAGAASTNWSADFVGEYARQEEARRRAAEEERRRAEGGDAGRAYSFDEFMRDPLGWVEREVRRAQRRAQQRAEQRAEQEARGFREGGGDDFYEQFRWQRQWQQQQQRQQQQQQQGQWRRQQFGGGGRPGAGAGSAGGGGGAPGDPLGYYRALGVKPTATTAEIAEAFRGLALKHHPDRAADKDKEAATRAFQRVTEAYQVLRDRRKRARYDATGSA